MITPEDWALIRRLYTGEGLAKAEIARQLGKVPTLAAAEPPAGSDDEIVAVRSVEVDFGRSLTVSLPRLVFRRAELAPMEST